MPYRILVTPAAARDLRKLPPEHRDRVERAIRRLVDEPRRGAERLVGQEEFRIRIGDYRVVFRVDDAGQRILIVRAKHRREVYRR